MIPWQQAAAELPHWKPLWSPVWQLPFLTQDADPLGPKIVV